MCYAIIKIKYSVDKDPPTLKEIETKEDLAREQVQLERIGTVASITVYLNHHTHKLVSTWADELYREPDPTPTPPFDVPLGVPGVKA